MYLRLHSEGMLTDVHNWLRCLFVVSKVCKGNKKKDTQKVSFFLALQRDSKTKSQYANDEQLP